VLIPVFVSAPTTLSSDQQKFKRYVDSQLADLGLQPRALGRSDYPAQYPLREVMVIAQHCSGGIVLGFEQFYAPKGTFKRDTGEKRPASKVRFPTPWNNLEAGILFSLKKPILIFREPGITGGVFDAGVTDVFVHDIPEGNQLRKKRAAIREVLLAWRGRVGAHYYGEEKL
jgi:hypothetical protein